MKKTKVLFVCSGNICRSPSAEAVFRKLVEIKGLKDQFEIDSAGTGSWHVGESPDRRMKMHAKNRGYNLAGISRRINSYTDFDYYDFIIGMDNYNIRDLKDIAINESDLSKIHKMTDFSVAFNYDEIPDPWYGGEEGFELVLDLLEDSCNGLLEKLNETQSYSK